MILTDLGSLLHVSRLVVYANSGAVIAVLPWCSSYSSERTRTNTIAGFMGPGWRYSGLGWKGANP